MNETVDLSEAPRIENGPDQMAWQQCHDFETACTLTAEWLEGKRHFQPGYMAAQPALETGPISQSLADINRLGFLTTDSQPGEVLEDGQGQRAYVTGLCRVETASTLSEELLKTDLVALWFPPGKSGRGQICVSIDDHQEFTHLGLSASPEERFAEYLDEANEVLAGVLSDMWELHIFDPVWGRNGKLIPGLEAALAKLQGAGA